MSLKWIKSAYEDYTKGKQTLYQLSLKYKRSIPTIHKRFEEYEPLSGEMDIIESPVNLVFDATYFGRGYGIILFRANQKNLYWQEIISEKLTIIDECFNSLEALGYSFKSFTIDGRAGVARYLNNRYSKVPIQFCQFHQVQIITRYTTRSPKTDCGVRLRKLILKFKNLNRSCFEKKFNRLKGKYSNFLKEKNENGEYMHKKLRSAFRSIKTNLPYLFTYLDYPNLNIPNTTNSCDGTFSQLKKKLAIHSGLEKHRRKKMIDFFLKN